MTQEQRTNIKFLAKLGKSPTETFVLLQKVYEDETMSRARVFEWHKRFCEGREVEDNPKSVKSDMNIQLVNELARKYRRLTIRMMAEELEMSRVRQNNLGGEFGNEEDLCKNGAQTAFRRTEVTAHGSL